MDEAWPHCSLPSLLQVGVQAMHSLPADPPWEHCFCSCRSQAAPPALLQGASLRILTKEPNFWPA